MNLSKAINIFINENRYLFDNSKINIYYDNGQKQISHILASVFSLFDCEFRIIKPKDYRLFQIADLVTTFELINYKRDTIGNSKSELKFFGSMRNFNKDFYKKITKKKLN